MSDPLREELQRHATALRGLAHDLLRDPHAADDVTQQTLTKAWSARGQLRPGPMGGWLSRTLVNFSRQWRRGERRRTQREERIARDHTEAAERASPAETLARRETLLAVTTAVLRLDEPYQTAIFMRYFEDLPPRAIARRLDASVATVKSRLTRGLAMLRHELSRSQGPEPHDWRPALAATLGFPFGSVLLPVTTGVLLVKTSLKIAIAVALLCIGGLMLYRGNSAPPPPRPADGEAPRNAAAALSTIAPNTTEAATERIAAPPPEVSDPWLSHPYELELEILVLDPLGLPVAGFKPELAPLGGTLRNAADATDDHGKVVVRWAARQQRVDIEVLDPRRHRRLVSLVHGRRSRLTLLDASRSEARELGFVSFLRTEGTKAQKKLPNATTSSSLQAGLHPHAVFSESGLVRVKPATPNPPQELALNMGGTITYLPTLSAGRFAVSIDSFVPNREAEAETAADGVLEGTVYGEDGKPAAETPVALLGSGPQPLHRTKTDAQGRFRFEHLVAGTFGVRAGGDAGGLAKVSVPVGLGVAQATLQLRREACIRGMARDAKGGPIAEATVEWHAADGTWADSTMTRSDGTFVLANLPSAPGRMFAWAKGGDRVFPIATADGVLPDAGDVILDVAADEGSTLQLQPQLPEGLDFGQLRPRLRQLETGFSRAITVPRVQTEMIDAERKARRSSMQMPTNPWHLDHLPAGNYQVEVWLPGSGYTNLGSHWLDGKSKADIGSIVLPQPGRLRFDVPQDKSYPEGLSVEITSLRREFDVRIETLDDLDHELLLAPGEYALACRVGDQTAKFTRFAIKSGHSTLVPAVW